MFVRLRISLPRIKLAASNLDGGSSASWGREFTILWNVASPEAPRNPKSESDESANAQTKDVYRIFTVHR